MAIMRFNLFSVNFLKQEPRHTLSLLVTQFMTNIWLTIENKWTYDIKIWIKKSINSMEWLIKLYRRRFSYIYFCVAWLLVITTKEVVFFSVHNYVHQQIICSFIFHLQVLYAAHWIYILYCIYYLRFRWISARTQNLIRSLKFDVSLALIDFLIFDKRLNLSTD